MVSASVIAYLVMQNWTGTNKKVLTLLSRRLNVWPEEEGDSEVTVNVNGEKDQQHFQLDPGTKLSSGVSQTSLEQRLRDMDIINDIESV